MENEEPDAEELLGISQMGLVSAILRWVDRAGMKTISSRQLNAIIKSADVIIDALERPDVLSRPGMGLAAWLASDDTGQSSLYMARALAPLVGFAGVVHSVVSKEPWPPDPATSSGGAEPARTPDDGAAEDAPEELALVKACGRVQVPARGLHSDTAPEVIRAKHRRLVEKYLARHPEASAKRISRAVALPVWNVMCALAAVRGEPMPEPITQKVSDPKKAYRSGFGQRAKVKRWRRDNRKAGAA